MPPGIPGLHKATLHLTCNKLGSQIHKVNIRFYLGGGFLCPATSSASLIPDPWSSFLSHRSDTQSCASSSWHLYPRELAILSHHSAPLSSLQWSYFFSTMPPVYHLPQRVSYDLCPRPGTLLLPHPLFLPSLCGCFRASSFMKPKCQ